MTDRKTYDSPHAMRQALRDAGGDWAQVLTAAQLNTTLPPESWGGHPTLRSWLADGADSQACSIIFFVAHRL